MNVLGFKHGLLWAMLCCIGGLTFGQGWEKTYGGASLEGWEDVLPTPDGGFVLVGSTRSFSSSGSDYDLWLAKTNADGVLEWNQALGVPEVNEIGRSIAPTPDGGYLIGGVAVTHGVEQALLLKTDAFGQQEWLYLSADSTAGYEAIPLLEGGYALAGHRLQDSPPNAPQPNYDFFLEKVDTAGNSLWMHSYGNDFPEQCFALLQSQTDSGLVLVGYQRPSANGNHNIFLLKTDTAGTLLWSRVYGLAAFEEVATDALENTNGDLVLTGYKQDSTAQFKDPFLFRLDDTGQALWWKSLDAPGLQAAFALNSTADGGYVLSGEHSPAPGAERNLLLLKTDSSGMLQWSKTFGGPLGEGGRAVVELPDGYAAAGFTTSFGAGNQDAYLVRTDSTGLSLTNLIQGQVRADFYGSCDPEGVGVGMPGRIVEAVGAHTYYATTDSSGNYAIPVEAGTYTVFIREQSPYWTPCVDSSIVVFAGSFDTATVDFSLIPEVTCPLLSVDVSTANLRRCFPNVYRVQYCNQGTEAAFQPQLTLEFDPYIQVDSAGIPWSSQNGQTYTFSLDTLDVFECGSFPIFVTLLCDSTVLGQTHCVEAAITPDSLCLPPAPTWDGSLIELDARCVGDSVLFFIRNVGEGDMNGPLEFVIIEDQILGMTGTFTLDAGKDTIIVWQPEGATVRMEAAQSPGYPGRSSPAVAVEGCGGQPFSTGYVIQFPQNDADPFVDVDCRENSGSFDPNDKQGFPLGYGDEHLIEPGTDLEYLIRFQNTGTDTAFRVIIRDTLSPHLDIRSVRPGAASHPYLFRVYGKRVLEFSFPDILLPDSSTNEPASHGFVKFRVSQMPFTRPGDRIQNRAAIYFDFNAPVITNAVVHQVGENFVIVDPVLSAPGAAKPRPAVVVAPNPFHESTRFELLHADAAPQGIFRLYDLRGTLLDEFSFQGKSFRFQRGNLPAGTYVFQIFLQGTPQISGKVVLR